MSFDFSALEAAAVTNNFTKGSTRTPIYALSIEDARAKVKVKDGNKKPKEDGSVALTLTFGKRTLPLDVIKPKATRINATAEQVEQFTSVLETAVAEGAFDEIIIAAQAEAEAAANKAKANVEAGVPSEAAEGIDLDALGGEETTEEAGEDELLED